VSADSNTTTRRTKTDDREREADMAGTGEATGGWLRQVRRLFGLGTVEGLSDGQLLDEFVSRRGDSEAAFEALMHRHGPMVLRICRRVLHDPQDAEDAFQATFLVLAHRAGAIRRRDSLASWLFGVSQRVAAQARLRSARRRVGEQHVAEQTPEAYRPAETHEEPEALIEEIDRLPERLRAVVVLCYLEGLTYDAAARRLGLSEGSVRGRLARARDQLRRRLTRRGVVLPAGFLALGTIAEGNLRAATSIPLATSLVDSTARIALGVQAGETAAALARGVLHSMLLGRLRTAAVVLVAVVGSGLMAWRALAARDDDKARPVQQPEPARAAASPAPGRSSDDTDRKYAVAGRVSVEGTDEPVPGARLQAVLRRSSGGDPLLDESEDFSRDVRTGADGRFRVDLPAGYTEIHLGELPPGYYDPRRSRPWRDVILSREAPESQQNYLVRRGYTWEFQVRRDSGGPLADAKVYFLSASTAVIQDYFGYSDPSGKAIVTLPPDGRKLVGDVGGPHVDVKAVHFELEWESGFRPDAVRSTAPDHGKPGHLYEAISPQLARALAQAPGKSSRFVITDEGGKSAVIGAIVPLEPVIEHGKLVIRVVTSDLDVYRDGALTGLVLDPQGKPVAGARVGLVFFIDRGRDGLLSTDRQNWATSDAQGRYRIDVITRGDHDAGPSLVQVVVTKSGFARSESETVVLDRRKAQPLELAPIRLGRDAALRGTVVDPPGRPVEGAWVVVSPRSIRNESRSVRTDKDGHFALQGLSSGPNQLSVTYGDLLGGESLAAIDPAREVVVRLRPRLQPEASRAVAKTQAKAEPRSPATGQAAPDWEVGPWSDGKARRLADYRGKIVFLDFWGIWCGPCISSLPVLTKLRERFESQGVVFLSIHTPGEDDAAIRRVLLANKTSLVYALDRARNGDSSDREGVTADRYGIRGFPSVFLIDRAGKIAFRDGDPSIRPKVEALIKETGIDVSPGQFTEEKSRILLEKLFAREIEGLLKK
jgi:RNA polymerase sigma factor (sigma-70 family)